MFIMCIVSFPYAFLPRNHEHFMNWKDRKPFEERAAPWAGLKTWPAIAVDQDTASRTKRGEPNLWTHFGKRVRMLACSIRCFEHLVVSNRKWIVPPQYWGSFDYLHYRLAIYETLIFYTHMWSWQWFIVRENGGCTSDTLRVSDLDDLVPLFLNSST